MPLKTSDLSMNLCQTRLITHAIYSTHSVSCPQTTMTSANTSASAAYERVTCCFFSLISRNMFFFAIWVPGLNWWLIVGLTRAACFCIRFNLWCFFLWVCLATFLIRNYYQTLSTFRLKTFKIALIILCTMHLEKASIENFRR